jgi:hypothetical protein
MDAKWADQRKKQWGEKSALFQNHVLGEFATQDESSVIPLAWVEAAIDRFHARVAAGEPLPPLSSIGLDVADGGDDRSILTPRHGFVVPEIRDVTQAESGSTMALAGIVTALCHNKRGVVAVIDSIGVGAGVVSRCRENEIPVVGFNAGAGTKRRDESGSFGFVNCRAAAWYGMRERLHPETGDDIALPPDDEMIGDLTAPTWKQTSSGKIQIEAKDEIKARLKRSPDRGDSVVMSFWSGADEPETETKPEDYRPSVSAEMAASMVPTEMPSDRFGVVAKEPGAPAWRSIHDEGGGLM